MSRLVQCTCRSHCLAFNSETQSYEGEGVLIPKTTAANHRQDDLLSQTLDAFTENVATEVLNYSAPPPEVHHSSHPRSNDQRSPPPGLHDQPHPDDLFSVLQAETVYRCTWAPINHSLVFSMPPPPTLQYQYPPTSKAHVPNRKPYSLDPGNVANSVYLENESRLYEILRALGRRPVSDARDCLLSRVYEGLVMMERHKEVEWNRQRAGSLARHHGYSVVDAGMYHISSSFLEQLSEDSYVKAPISTTRFQMIRSSPHAS